MLVRSMLIAKRRAMLAIDQVAVPAAQKAR